MCPLPTPKHLAFVRMLSMFHLENRPTIRFCYFLFARVFGPLSIFERSRCGISRFAVHFAQIAGDKLFAFWKSQKNAIIINSEWQWRIRRES